MMRLLGLLLLAGCGPATTQAYRGEARPAKEVARVLIHVDPAPRGHKGFRIVEIHLDEVAERTGTT